MYIGSKLNLNSHQNTRPKQCGGLHSLDSDRPLYHNANKEIGFQLIFMYFSCKSVIIMKLSCKLRFGAWSWKQISFISANQAIKSSDSFKCHSVISPYCYEMD